MARSVVVDERNTKRKTKVKTGCGTCRIRKVKCDEDKPSCRKCLNTGRKCDGYESPFRSYTCQPVSNVHAIGIKLGTDLKTSRPVNIEITSGDIELLNRYFSTKTIFNVNLGCDEEARQILQASLTDPPIRHAILSLRALREDLETSGDSPWSVGRQTSGYHYGLQQYNMALGGLASNLSIPSTSGLKSALLCCQIFISIEQVRKNYAAMAQHIVRGLKIMREYGARPSLDGASRLVTTHHGHLPLLDVFIIKLFAAPCKFADPSMKAVMSGKTSPVSLKSSDQQPGESHDLRTIASNIRTELTSIAASTLVFLSQVSQIQAANTAHQLLSEKTALLDSLHSWLNKLDSVPTEINSSDSEPISISFLRLFYLILRMVLLGALDSSSDFDEELQINGDRLQKVADKLGKTLRNYEMSREIGNG